MSHSKDGGRAFASIDRLICAPDEHHPGMSKLEWFAGQALAGMLAGRHADIYLEEPGNRPDDMAYQAFAFAEAMIAERERRMK